MVLVQALVQDRSQLCLWLVDCTILQIVQFGLSVFHLIESLWHDVLTDVVSAISPVSNALLTVFS